MRFVTGAALTLCLALRAHTETDREARLAMPRMMPGIEEITARVSEAD